MAAGFGARTEAARVTRRLQHATLRRCKAGFWWAQIDSRLAVPRNFALRARFRGNDDSEVPTLVAGVVKLFLIPANVGTHFLLRDESLSERKRQIKPAPRAHLYLAPSTATGISVEYGYAGIP